MYTLILYMYGRVQCSRCINEMNEVLFTKIYDDKFVCLLRGILQFAQQVMLITSLHRGKIDGHSLLVCAHSGLRSGGDGAEKRVKRDGVC
ncbi:Chaperone protein HscA [Trichinella pseudospiralis]